jgi:Mrp family chromosome partitioning ATPase
VIATKFIADTAAPRSSSLIERQIVEFPVARPNDLPIVDLIELYAGIEYALSAPRGSVVQLVSPDSDLAAEHIGFQLARAGACALGKRVLLLRHQMVDGDRTYPRAVEDAPLRPAVNGHRDLKQTMVRIGGLDVFLANLGDWRSRNSALTAADELDRQLDELRGLLDMVLVVAPPADRDPSSVVMARHVDGNIIVVEAEHSRAAAAIRLRETLARSGRPILGSVLTGRQRYIPRWLARFL